MANGKPAEHPEEYVIRSGVRSGLKREFAFALKSQSELSSSLGRTRSRKPSSPISSFSSLDDAKRFKVEKTDEIDESPIKGVVDVRPMKEEEPPIVIDAPADETKVEDLGISSEAPAMEQEGPVLETPVVVNVKDGMLKESPSRRFTRSLLKPPADDNSAGENVSVTTTSGGSSVGSDVMKGGANVDDGSSSLTPTKNMELKMSKKIALDKLPMNVRDLLKTGLLEGLPVKYVVYVGKQYGLEGVITGNGILCSCSVCKGCRIVSAYNFEIHAGSTKKHPSDYIFLENGKSLHDVLRACTSAPLDMLGSVIQNAIGEAPPNEPSTCQKCKGLFHSPRIGKFALLCDTCLEPKQHLPFQSRLEPKQHLPFQSIPSSPRFRSKELPVGATDDTPKPALSRRKIILTDKVLAGDATEDVSKKKSLRKELPVGATDDTPKPALSRRKIILTDKVLAGDATEDVSKKKSLQKKRILPAKDLTGDASDSSSKKTSQKKSMGKLTRKDVGLHRLVFMDDILPEGTEVGYYVRGKRLLEGYIKDSGIYCQCCNNVLSPSQFEAHAGRASRRKPYNNIYTSNGVSLHELSVSLSKGRKLTANENDDLCSICADGGDLLLCDLCPRAFHKECAGLSSVPTGDWHCRYCKDLHQRERSLSTNDNAIAAGRVAGVDPIEQIIKRCIRIVSTSTDIGSCVLCRCHDFSRSGFDNRTVIICDQCEKEYHVGCLRDHNMCDLKELPEGEWFCSTGCSRLRAALQELLLKSQPLQDVHIDIIKKKFEEKGINKDGNTHVRWRLLSGKTSPADTKLLLSEAVTIFHESFDPIVDSVSGRDLIPSMVYGREDFGGMYCVVLTVNSSVVSAGVLRVLGDVAELPLVATSRESQGLGYFQSLFSCIEKLLESLEVKHFVLPSADEAEAIWTKKFGFGKITQDQLVQHTKGAHPMFFHGTSMLYKAVPVTS